MIYRETDTGKTIQARVNKSIIVELEENPTTGYRWIAGVIAPEDPTAVWLSNEYRPSKPIRVGSGGILHLTIRPKKVGHFTLSFHLERSWESNPPIKTFEIALEVES